MSKAVTEGGESIQGGGGRRPAPGLPNGPEPATPRREAGVGAVTAPAEAPTKRWRLLIALLAAGVAIAAVTTWRAHERAEALAAQTVLAKAQLEDASQALDHYREVAAADALLLAGDYREARRAYESLAADTTAAPAPAVDLEARLDHIGLLTSYLYELDTLRDLAGRPPREVFVSLPARPLPAPVAPLTLERTRPGQYDSLNFALRKAEMRVRSLEGRLRQNSGGNYLTFESAQGNDVYYVGDVRDGKANGSGVALLSSGSRYQGEWRDNRRHGQGTFYWPDGAYYEGAYVDGERDGQGTYHFPDGSMFVGDWEADLRNGQGIFYDKNGEVLARGEWEDDEYLGGK